ncbi:FAD-binding dehydrogenase [Yimella sp. cx-51]|uniref:FAD-binding dehydrogenase n=1 Tax=Yimella sp. cx-51 TaxID=2770551 RepID=UPI00165E5CDA|nr:FAD-binding dehydrogenase [Yimella sp. cx-51]MBC9955602.1 FAD-binding dehydrogenase [Yimella sp. cx-51]QTH37822.1 FAD-binding dehydrogenase [Yimella sp. cx-51]
MDADVIVVGGGLAGLVATAELVAAGRTVLVVDQENEANLGGQAWWSFGGIFLVDSPEQRRMGIKDSHELAWQDWQGSAQWDRLDSEHDEDHWAQQWGRAYVDFAATIKREYLTGKGVKFTPMVGWAERGEGKAVGHGNSVPRFHVPWGTGTGIADPFVDLAREAAGRGLVTFKHRHRVDELITHDGTVTGVRGRVLAPDDSARGVSSNRDEVADFELRASAVVVASGGIGGNHETVRKYWPERLGTPPKHMITGVPAHVDGRMIDITAEAGGRLVNRDRMWHYVEGVHNWDPVWPGHAIRILSAPSPMWFDALGRQLPAPYLPSYDTLGTLRYLRTTPDIAQYDHSWFVLTSTMIAKEFALSGSEQNLDLTGRDVKAVLKSRVSKAVPREVQAFVDQGVDFVTADTLPELVAKMNAITDEPLLDAELMEQQIVARDREIDNRYTKDFSVGAIHNARRYRGDKLSRVTAPHKMLDPKHGPLIGVRLNVLTRKTLGGIQTDLESRVLGHDGAPIPGLYAAGEAAGFGGGGVHGKNALEGTFLGGCIFSGRAAGLSVARSWG